MNMNVWKIQNNYTKTDRTTSLPTARIECWIMTIEEQEVTLKTGPNWEFHSVGRDNQTPFFDQ